MKTILLFFLSSCYKNHFYVQQEKIDRNFLASSYVQTPDPLQEDPPLGQRLVIGWEFPRSTFLKELHLILTIRFWDGTQEMITKPLERRRDYFVLFFPQEGDGKRILTYRVQAFSKDGKQVGEWVHQLWTELINVGES